MSQNGWKHHPFFGARFSINFWILKKSSQLHTAPVQKCSVFLYKFPILTAKREPPFCQFFLVWLRSKTYLSICRDLIFFLHIGTHPSKTGEDLVYYHLYHEEASFYLNVRSQLFNKPLSFVYFKLTITYIDLKYLFLSLYKNYVNR